MKIIYAPPLLLALLLLGCNSTQKSLYADESAASIALVSPVRNVPAVVPEKPVPEITGTPYSILGKGKTNPADLVNFLTKTNPFVDKDFARDFAEIYIEEASVEGVNHDIAFSQMCLETGFLSYGGLVTPDMNNFAGLGSTGPGVPGEKFSSPRIGVRAQIQHLKSYATDAPLNQDLVDPRRHFVVMGSAPTIDGLAGTWAEDREYAQKLKAILDRLYTISFGVTNG
jgi:hypothetical protein